MKQIEEDDVRVEQQQKTDAAARAHEAARQARITVEEKCLLGFLDFARQRRTA